MLECRAAFGLVVLSADLGTAAQHCAHRHGADRSGLWEKSRGLGNVLPFSAAHSNHPLVRQGRKGQKWEGNGEKWGGGERKKGKKVGRKKRERGRKKEGEKGEKKRGRKKKPAKQTQGAKSHCAEVRRLRGGTVGDGATTAHGATAFRKQSAGEKSKTHQKKESKEHSFF